MKGFSAAFCGAVLGLAGVAGLVSPAGAMTFDLVAVGGARCGGGCPQVIAAEGEIGRDSAEEFVDFLRGRVGSGRLRAIVFLHSPGGNVVGAIKLGSLFRKMGAAVVVARASEGQGIGGDASFTAARCLSACVYALMGGKKRVIPPESRLAVHRTSSFQFVGKDPANSAPGYQKIQTPAEVIAALNAYTRSMGVSTAVIDLAQSTASDSMRILTRAELSKWRLGVERF
ncbi:MAG: hypothetical protein IPL88_07445 [Rhizobiales bacterium]|nr:hypothetical protein [Hyphomicrobiales bacterium]